LKVVASTLRSDLRVAPVCEVWKISVCDQHSRLPQHWQRLAPAEQARAARFRQSADHARFVIGRSVLRESLGRLLAVAPDQVEFQSGASGKPALRRPSAGLHFNISHSGDWVLQAFCSAGPVGVDVEAHRSDMLRLEDFDSVFAPSDRAALFALAGDDRVAAFARFWVRKEAYVKALGDGLSRSLTQISIGPGNDGQPMLLYDRNPGEAKRWRFTDIEIDPTHAGCLVRPETAEAPRIRDYREPPG
jgi:4'-phosphopantetheinyl transferase